MWAESSNGNWRTTLWSQVKKDSLLFALQITEDETNAVDKKKIQCPFFTFSYFRKANLEKNSLGGKRKEKSKNFYDGTDILLFTADENTLHPKLQSTPFKSNTAQNTSW